MNKTALAFVFCYSIALNAAAPPLTLAVRSIVYTDSNDPTLLADVNGDGHPDLIGQGTGGFTVRLNNGSGRFAGTPAVYPINKSDGDLLSFSFVVADFNRDGRPDIAAVTNLGIYVYPGNGKGGFGAGQRTSIRGNVRGLNATTGDFNGDGFPDIASGLPGSGIHVFLGDGKGDFQERAAPLIDARFTNPLVQAWDLGNGISDLIAIDALDRTVTILRNDGTGAFRAAQILQSDSFSRPMGFTVGDFNGDKKPDLAILFLRVVMVPGNVLFETPVELWTQDANGMFQMTQTVATGLTSVNSVNAADVNGDGKIDLITTNATATNVYFGDGAGNFSAATSIGVVGQVLAADLEGTGSAEIVLLMAKQISVVGSGLAASGVTLMRNLSPFTYGISDEFTVTIAPGPLTAGFATGIVTLFDGSQAVAKKSVFDGVAHFSIPFVPGNHLYHAEYSGDGQFGPGYADLAVLEAGSPAKVMGYAPPAVQAQVLDAAGNPVGGVGVIFSAPLSGPSGTFEGATSVLVITGADGVAQTPKFVPNGFRGYYSIAITVSGYPALGSSVLLRNL